MPVEAAASGDELALGDGRNSWPVQVVGELVDWVGHGPKQLQAMPEALAVCADSVSHSTQNDALRTRSGLHQTGRPEGVD